MINKLFIYCSFLISSFLSAQQAKDAECTWHNESAIVLELDKEYEAFSGFQDEIIIREKIHKKILLKDEAALQAFSTLHISVSEYDNSTGETSNNLKVSVRKKNGQVLELSNNDAFVLKMSYDKNLQVNAFTYLKKIAIPGLEINDTLEYEYTTSSGDREFFIGNVLLAEEYPIRKMKVSFEVESSLAFSYTTNNCSLILQRNGDRNGTTSRNYSVQLDSVSKQKGELWSYESRTIPSIRFKTEYDPEFQLLRSDPKKTLQNSIATYLYNSDSYKENRHYIKKIKKHLRNLFNSKVNEDSVAIKGWYYFRYLILRDLHSDAPYKSENEKELNISDELYCSIMLQLLREMNVPAKLICYVPRNKGDLNYALSPWDYKIAVQVGEGKNAFILYNFSEVSTHGDVPENADGVEAFSFSANKSYRKTKFRWVLTLNPTLIILPGAVYVTEASVKKIRQKEDLKKTETHKADPFSNLLSAEYFVDISELQKNDSLGVSRVTTKTGNFKKEGIANLISHDEAFAEDQNQFEQKSKIKKNSNETEDKYFALLGLLQEEKCRNYLISSIEENEIDVLKYDDFKLLSSGRSIISQSLIYKENYIIGNTYNKADTNTFIITPGAITGSQLALSEHEMTRSSDVYFGFPRAIKNKIFITVPVGYKAGNLHDFNIHNESSSGYFTSTAKQEGNSVIIEMTKVYVVNHVKKEDWPEMTTWLEAAYHFTQKKLIFSKE